MTKKTETEKRISKLEKIAVDKKRPKKERRAARAEADALRGVFVPSEATGTIGAEPSSPFTSGGGPVSSPDGSAPGESRSDRLAAVDRDGRPVFAPDGETPADPVFGDEKVAAWRARQDAEVARQWAHHTVQLADPTGIAADLIVDERTEAAIAHATGLLTLEAPFPAERVVIGDDGVIRFRPTDEDLERQFGTTDIDAVIPQEARVVETDHGREFAVGTRVTEAEERAITEERIDSPTVAPEPLPEKPADPVLENGNGQPIIHYIDPTTGKEKVKGYTRVTTYIDCLEDKTILEKWKSRILLEGGAVELLQNGGASPSLEAVGRAVKRLDDALADIDRREKVEGELLGLRRAELLKEHRDLLAKIAEDLLELGGAHDKAIKGTDLHRLTEIVDNGQPLPVGTSASDRRDVEAYQDAMRALGAEVLWTERRIVLDDIQVSGTMDRAYMVKLPGMARRVRVVGDLKTGSVSFAQGKVAMQLALYARGLGYDWTKPLERERLVLNQHHGLLIHLPQGEGRCSVYLVDLELAGKGLDLARNVREWRNTGKRAYDLKAPIAAVER